MAVGLNDSTIRVYTLVSDKKLKEMRPVHELELLDKESGELN
jgi:hypothetical protein